MLSDLLADIAPSSRPDPVSHSSPFGTPKDTDVPSALRSAVPTPWSSSPPLPPLPTLPPPQGADCSPASLPDALRSSAHAFLRQRFDEAYRTALTKASAQAAALKGQSDNRRAEHMPQRQADMDRIRAQLEQKLHEERMRLRAAAYRRRANALAVQLRERRASYHTRLEQYYASRATVREGAAMEVALRTPAAEISAAQIPLLRRALLSLREDAAAAEETQRMRNERCSVAASTAAQRVERQYLLILAEQRREADMLRRWKEEMTGLERMVDDCMEAFAAQRKRREREGERAFGERDFGDTYVETGMNHRGGLFEYMPQTRKTAS